MSKQPPKKSADLAPLLRHFIGINLIIETKHGKSYQGKLVEADAYMNLVLSRDTTHTELHTTTSSSKLGIDTGVTGPILLDQLHIRGPSIRYVVFGRDVDIAGLIREGRDRERSAGDRYRRGVRKSK